MPIHVSDMNTMMLEAHRIAREKGWWSDPSQIYRRSIPEAVALLHSECSEALEAYRDTVPGEVHLSTEAVMKEGEKLRKPEGFGVELADLAIRLMDLAQGLNIPLVDLIWRKMEYNEQREWRHGGKRA